ncbi:MAG: TRAP transporter small permease subunit [Spirochaetia bacterium]|nr:TRAP transporter small permease subunit [Spirochaetia bacterium]MCF7945905.1 TRAP transporter small permease subunit [Spirochaetia bacterium]
MHAFIRRSCRILENIAILFLVLLFSSVLIQIIMRNFFNNGSVKLEELARFSLVSIVFIMVPVLIVDKQHIIVDILLVRLPTKARRFFEILIQSLSFGIAVFMMFSVNHVMIRNWSVRTPALRMPNFILYIPIVLGLVFMALGSFLYLMDAFRPPDGTKNNPDGTKSNPDGTKSNPDGTKSNPDGTKSNPDGVHDGLMNSKTPHEKTNEVKHEEDKL